MGACGHSRGGFAAVLAAYGDKRFSACLALAPSGPATAPESEHRPPTFIVVGDRDGLLAPCRKLHGALGGYLVTIEGMNHGFLPPEAGMKVLARATAFLKYRVSGDERYRKHLVESAPGIQVAVKE